MLTRTADEEPGLPASGIDAGAIDGLHSELRIRPFPLLPFFIRTTDPQALLGPNEHYGFTHSSRLPVQTDHASGLWTQPRRQTHRATDVSLSWLAVTAIEPRRWRRWTVVHQQVGRCSGAPRPPGARRDRRRSWSRTVSRRRVRNAALTVRNRSSEGHRQRTGGRG